MPFDDVCGATAVDCWVPKVLDGLDVLLPKGFASPNDGVAVDGLPLPKPTDF